MLRLPRTWTLILASLAGCATTPSPSASEVKRSQLFELGEQERSMMAVVLKSTVRLDGSRGSGSGLAISPDGKVVTAWHVIDGTSFSYSRDGGPKETRTTGGGRYQDRAFSNPAIIAAFPDQDIAILDIGIPTPNFVVPSARGFAPGERVFLLGGADTGKAEFTECTKMRATLDHGSLLFAMNAPALPGDSGGGVINQQGELLGVLVRGRVRLLDPSEQEGLPGWQWISMMVPTPAQVVEEILRTGMPRTGTRLVFDPEPPEGKLNPEQAWKAIRLKAD